MGSSRTIVRLVLCLALFALVLSIASPSRATSIPVRTGSSYGTDTGFAACEATLLDNLNNGKSNTCEGAELGSFTIGSNTFQGGEFVFTDGSTDFGVLDIFTLDPSSQPVVFNLANFALPLGVFLCDTNNGTQVLDSNSLSSSLTGLACTSSTAPSRFSLQDPSNFGLLATFGLNSVTLQADNSVVLFATDGNILGATFTPGGTVVSTPEPGSLVLLGAGVAGLIGLRRRKN